MILLVDAGNSRIKWRVVDSGETVGEGVVAVQDLAERQNLGWPNEQLYQRILVSSVLNEGGNRQLAVALPPSRQVEWLEGRESCCGIRSLYRPANTLGSDRFAALVGAWHKTQQATVVIMAGTAVTVDCLNGQGEFVGGMILPGLQTMQKALSTHTGRLTMEEGAVCVLPQQTRDALASGRVFAICGGIEKAVAAWQREVGTQRVLLSGGDRNVLASHLALPLGVLLEQRKNLVLDGLQVLIGQPL